MQTTNRENLKHQNQTRKSKNTMRRKNHAAVQIPVESNSLAEIKMLETMSILSVRADEFLFSAFPYDLMISHAETLLFFILPLAMSA
jgi:hypothetical protein